MSNENEKWCSDCFATIQAGDDTTSTGVDKCKSCQAKQSKLKKFLEPQASLEAELIDKLIKSDGIHKLKKNISEANVLVMSFMALFALPSIDFIFLGSKLPYEFFVLLRLVAFSAFCLMAYAYKNSGKEISGLEYSIIFSGLALLYNPILPLELGRELWTLVNITTVGLLVHFTFFTTTSDSEKTSEASNEKSSTVSGGNRPSGMMSRKFIANYDKDVIAPMRLLKDQLNDQDYLENYNRIVDEFTLGFVHGFMAFATFQDHEAVSDYPHSLMKISPFTDGVLSSVFSQKECVDLRQNLNSDIASSNLWQEGFEWGWRNCETWQSDGEITTIWLEYIRRTRF